MPDKVRRQSRKEKDMQQIVPIENIQHIVLIVFAVISVIVWAIVMRQHFVRKELLAQDDVITTCATITAYHKGTAGIRADDMHHSSDDTMSFFFVTNEGQRINGNVKVWDWYGVRQRCPVGTRVKIKYSPKRPKLAWRFLTDDKGYYVHDEEGSDEKA